MAASKFASALIHDVYDNIFFGCSKADCQLDPNVSDRLREGTSGQVSISGYYWSMPAAFCSCTNRNLFSSLILGLGVEVMRRKSRNTIKSLCISQLVTFVFHLTQERLWILGSCDSLVQTRACFSFAQIQKDIGRRKPCLWKHSSVPVTVLDAFPRDLIEFPNNSRKRGFIFHILLRKLRFRGEGEKYILLCCAHCKWQNKLKQATVGLNGLWYFHSTV